MTREVIDCVPTGREVRNLAVLIPGIYAGGQTTPPIAQDVGGQSGQSATSRWPSMADGRPVSSFKSTACRCRPGRATTRPRCSSPTATFRNTRLTSPPTRLTSKPAASASTSFPEKAATSGKGASSPISAPMRLQSDNVTAELRARGLTDPIGSKNLDDQSFDRWTRQEGQALVFRDLYPASRRQLRGRPVHHRDPASWVYSPDLSRQAVDESWGRDVGVRLTWQATPRNKITGYSDYNELCHCTFTTGRGTSPEASTYLIAHNRTYQVTWTSPVTNRLLFEAGVSSRRSRRTSWPNPMPWRHRQRHRPGGQPSGPQRRHAGQNHQLELSAAPCPT